MAQVVLTVPDISCAHCERTVTEALSPLAGVQRVAVDIPTQQVQVDYDPAHVGIEQMKTVLADEDYPVAAVASQGEAGTPAVAPAATAIDPVCGMTVDPATARYTSDYQGETIYFCSAGCKRSFDADPAAYRR